MAPPAPETSSASILAVSTATNSTEPCVFPFEYNGTLHTACVCSGLASSAWCSLTPQAQQGRIGICPASAPTEASCTRQGSSAPLSSGLSTAAAVAIAVGVAMAGIIIVIYFVIQRRHKATVEMFVF